MGKKKVELPDRWLHYLPLGKRIPGTRFIAFKVPLKKTFESKLAPNERFSPQDLVNQIREQKEDLGLVIDLTCTTRYYGPEELPDTVQYCKIGTVGHRVPDKNTVFEFKNAVKKFLMENQYNDNLIGVHCTHGLNRTGYLICRYLIDVEGMDPNKAIELFNRCRGHCIERRNYIDSLCSGCERRNHHTAVSGCSRNRGHCGSAPNSEFQVHHRPPSWLQYPVQTQSHFSSERGGGQTQPRKSYHTWNQSSVTSYSSSQPVYGPRYSPMASMTQQRPGYYANPSHGLLSLQARGPYFPVHKPYYP